MEIVRFKINQDSSVFIIGELPANHNSSIETALQTTKAAARAGANAIKLQTYTADTITINSNNSDFEIKGTSGKDVICITFIRRPIGPGNGMDLHPN